MLLVFEDITDRKQRERDAVCSRLQQTLCHPRITAYFVRDSFHLYLRRI
jgi:hypothetical protein